MFKPTKPCPFCASESLRIEELPAGNHKEFAVMCQNCGAFGPNDLGQSGAVEMWELRRISGPTLAAPDECDLCGAPATTVKVSHYCAEHRSL